MSEGKSRRRWLRFGLRGGLAVLTVLCLWFGWTVNIVQQRSRLRQQERVERAQGPRWERAFLDDYEPPTMPSTWNPETQLRYLIQERDYNHHLLMKRKSTQPTSNGISSIRRWLGDEPVDMILVFDEQDRAAMRKLFPESHVYLMAPRKN